MNIRKSNTGTGKAGAWIMMSTAAASSLFNKISDSRTVSKTTIHRCYYLSFNVVDQ